MDTHLGEVISGFMEERGIEDVAELTEVMRSRTGYPFEVEGVASALAAPREAAYLVYFTGLNKGLGLSEEERDRMWDAFDRDLGLQGDG